MAGGYCDTCNGGWGTTLTSAELYNGTTSFSATGSMTTQRSGQRATLLPAGKVLLTAGDAADTTAELFDGISSFAATGSMTT